MNTAQCIELPPAAAGAASSLGAPLGSFALSRKYRRACIYAAIGVCMMIVGTTLFLLSDDFFGKQYFQQSVCLWQVTTAASFLLIILYLQSAIMALLTGHQQVWAFEQGLIVMRGSRIHTIRWGEIGTIRQLVRSMHWETFSNSPLEVSAIHVHTYRLWTHDGHRFVFRVALQGIAELGAILYERMTNLRLVQVLSELAEGGRLTLGPLAFSQQGIHYRHKTAPWPYLQSVTVADDGFLYIKAEARFLPFRILQHQVDDLYLLIAVTRQMAPQCTVSKEEIDVRPTLFGFRLGSRRG